QTCALPIFLRQRVGHKPAVSHRPRSSPRGAVEHRRRVTGAIGTTARNLRCPAVVEHPRNRTPYDHHADDLTVLRHADCESPALRRLVVPVVALDKRLRLAECDRDEFKAHALLRMQYNPT